MGPLVVVGNAACLPFDMAMAGGSGQAAGTAPHRVRFEGASVLQRDPDASRQIGGVPDRPSRRRARGPAAGCASARFAVPPGRVSRYTQAQVKRRECACRPRPAVHEGECLHARQGAACSPQAGRRVRDGCRTGRCCSAGRPTGAGRRIGVVSRIVAFHRAPSTASAPGGGVDGEVRSWCALPGPLPAAGVLEFGYLAGAVWTTAGR